MQFPRAFPRRGNDEEEESMINVLLRAVIFGIGVEIGREVYNAVKNMAIGEEEEAQPAAAAPQPVPPMEETQPAEKKKKEKSEESAEASDAPPDDAPDSGA